jgi:hypothetical protein
MSDLPDEKTSSTEKGPVFVQPRTDTTGGSNPLPRTKLRQIGVEIR